MAVDGACKGLRSRPLEGCQEERQRGGGRRKANTNPEHRVVP